MKKRNTSKQVLPALGILIYVLTVKTELTIVFCLAWLGAWFWGFMAMTLVKE